MTEAPADDLRTRRTQTTVIGISTAVPQIHDLMQDRIPSRPTGDPICQPTTPSGSVIPSPGPERLRDAKERPDRAYPLALLRSITSALADAMDAKDDDIGQLDAMERCLGSLITAGRRSSASEFLDMCVTALETAVWDHRGRPYTAHELTTLRDVVRRMHAGPAMQFEAYRACLHDLMHAGLSLAGPLAGSEWDPLADSAFTPRDP